MNTHPHRQHYLRQPPAPQAAERRARPRAPRTTPACTANRCRQGHHACPTPQACELPEEAPATRAEVAALLLAMAACVVAFGCIAVFGTSA